MVLDGDHNHVVLLVEDDPDVQDAMGTFLQCCGYQTVSATDGIDALDELGRGLRPCLIILDLNLPRLSGADFRRRQLADPAIADIPVVVLSAASDLTRRTARFDAAEVLSKPPDLEVVAAAVARHCQRGVRRSA